MIEYCIELNPLLIEIQEIFPERVAIQVEKEECTSLFTRFASLEGNISCF